MISASRFLGLASLAALGFAMPAAAQAPAQPAYSASDWKAVAPENLLVIDTTKGRVIVELMPQFSAEHVDRIKTLTRQGYYDGLKFFRVINDFMAQTGDRENTGAGIPDQPMLAGAFSFRRGPDAGFSGVRDAKGQTVGFIGPNQAISQPDDLMLMTADGKVKSSGLFCAGVAGMARAAAEDSASTQFFLMRQTNHSLDERYTPWGKVLVGLEVVRSINVGEPPQNPDVMTQVRIAADLPAAERPNVWRIDTASPAFRARLAAAAAQPGFDVCSVEVPAEVRK